MRSDNGTNFGLVPQRELREAIDLLDHDAIQNELGVNRLQWQFNCPRHPQADGCWERLEAANIVNSRPLSPMYR